MTPHTPVDTLESIVADMRNTNESVRLGGMGGLSRAMYPDELIDEWADRLASLPVEGWRVHLLDDAPFPNPLAVLTAPTGARHVVVKGDNELLWTFLAHIAQRQGNEQGGTHAPEP